MHTFKVWAPFAQTVALRMRGTTQRMRRADQDCWWSCETDVQPGEDYAFVIDEGDPVPDPRSPWQPRGIHGASRLIDQSAFSWTDQNWRPKPLSSAIVYELHIGTFTPEGTFRSAIHRLNYLADLGITHVELMPVNEFSGSWGWGYDGVDLYAPHHAYGNPDDLKEFVNACHGRGLAVLLDVVYNHFGPAGNYLNRFGPYFTAAHKTPWGDAVNLDDKGSGEVRLFLIENALMWLRDYHFDGLRLDAVHAFIDDSAIHFLEQLSSEVASLESHLGRQLVLVAESDLNDPRVITCREAGGYGINAQWNDDFHHSLHSVLTGEANGYYEDFGALSQLAKCLRHAYVYDGIYSKHRDRVHGRPLAHVFGHRFLAYSQNHDQVGNRGLGERLCHLVTLGQQKIAAALVLTSPFIPMLFQGEEFGASTPFQYFTRHEDPELAESVSDGRKGEFGAFGWLPEQVPDPQNPETFQRCKLRWDELRTEPHRSLFHWYKELIALRRSQPALTDGKMHEVKVNFDEHAGWIVIQRGPIQVACNLGAERQSVPVTDAAHTLISSEPCFDLRSETIVLPPDSVAILMSQTPHPGSPPTASNSPVHEAANA